MVITIKNIGYIKIIIIAVLIIGLYVGTANASWRFLSDQELVEESDLIVIGKIIDSTEKKVSSAELTNYWVTNWNVQVRHVIKGDQHLKNITVDTLGARNKGISTSTDFRLDVKGKEVLLFLSKVEGAYVPPSPQGIISAKEVSKDSEEIFARYQISDTELKKELEQYIAQSGTTFTFENDKAGLSVPITIIGTVGLIILLAVRSRRSVK